VSVQDADEQGAPVATQAILVDPRTMTVLWANEAAWEAAPGGDEAAAPGASVERVLPMAQTLGVPEALRDVSETGIARRLHAAVVSTSRGGVSLVVSIHRLPDGTLLLLAEHAWRAGRGRASRARG
jgi:hypothetical protein